jgi:hypothetical protein
MPEKPNTPVVKYGDVTLRVGVEVIARRRGRAKTGPDRERPSSTLFVTYGAASVRRIAITTRS